MNVHEQISTMTVTLSCRRKHFGIMLMLHIIAKATNVNSLHCLNKCIICKMTEKSICLQSIYDLKKKIKLFSGYSIKKKKTLCSIVSCLMNDESHLMSFHYNFTLIVCSQCFTMSAVDVISVYYTHLQSEGRQMPKQNFILSF